MTPATLGRSELPFLWTSTSDRGGACWRERSTTLQTPGSATPTPAFATRHPGSPSWGVRQYRPHFDLWTIWGAFSPVPYHAIHGGVWLRPIRTLELRAVGEHYAFSPTETETPLVTVDDDGDRVGVGIAYTPIARLSLDAGYRREQGPGGSSEGFEATITFRPAGELSLIAYGSTFERPLEFRFQDASVDALGLEAEWWPTDRLRLAAGAAHYWEARNRPDAAAIDWNQTRLTARATLVLRSQADVVPLPPALPRMPPAGVR